MSERTTAGSPRRPAFEHLEVRVLLDVTPVGQVPLEALAEARQVCLPGVSLGPYVQDHGAWLDLDADDGLGLGAAASVRLLDSSADGIAGEVVVPGAWIEPLKLGGTKFARLAIPGYGYTDVVGEPQLPVVRQLLAVPDGAVIAAEIVGEYLVLSMEALGIDSPLAPQQASVPKLPGALEAATLELNRLTYLTDEFAPEAGVRVVEAGYLAGQRLVMLEITPIAYNPARGELRAYETLTFNVSFEGGEDAPPAGLAADYVANGGPKSPGRLLVIVHDYFASQLASYVTHKTAMGWTVDVADTTTAGTTTSAIRSYIQSRYADPLTRPDALLLVGDTDRIPHFTGSGSGSPDTDLYYACMDAGDDWMPEFPVGRFSARTSAQLTAMVDKTIEYENAPAADWMAHAVFMASVDNYTISEGTHNWVIDNHLDPQGYTSDKLYQVTYGATTQDVRNSFNDGRVYGVFSGHGSSTSWADGPPFSQADVNNLTNAGMYPFVGSFACNTGDYVISEGFAETWLRAANKGAVVMWASSISSYWTEDDILEKRLFDAIYDYGFTDFGGATLKAKQLYLDHFGAISRTRAYFEQYNLFGDPTVALPSQELSITTPAELPLGYVGEAYEVTLTARSGVEPLTWELIDGQLPPGLALDAETGVISGDPAASGTEVFTIRVTDAAEATATREFHLPVVVRLAITTPPELPDGSLGQPYGVTVEAQGGSSPYAWTAVATGDYEETQPPAGYLGGGVARGWRADDASWTLTLPWDFPFYGAEHDAVNVCSNGFLDFASESNDWTNSQAELIANVRIAPLWDDLLTSGTGEDIYVTETADYVAIRWDGQTWSGEYPVDFEAVLYRDGRMAFNYGQAHSGLTPTIGLSSGDGSRYLFSIRDGAGSIPADVTSLFARGGALPPGLSLNGATGEISGAPAETGEFAFTLKVQDGGTPQQTDTREFTLEVTEMPPLTVAVPGSATEGDGVLSGEGSVSVPAPVGSDLTVALQSDDASEVTLPAATATILAGHSSATFDLRIADDAVLDGTQAATISASAAGYQDAADAIAVHDNETATLTVTVPPSAWEGDGLLADAGTVTVGAPPADDVVVALSSDDPGEAAVPASVTIPAGQVSASFDLTVIDDAVIDGTQTATVTAHVENWTDGSGGIDVQDDDAHLSVTVPQKVWEGQGTLADAGTVTIGGTLPADLEVSLAADDPSELTVPEAVTIPAGETSAAFDVTVIDDPDRDGSQPVTVTATAPDLDAGEDQTTVGDDDVHHFALDEVPSPQTVGVPFVLTIAAKDVNGETIEVYEGAVYLTGAGDGGPVPVEVNPGQGQPPAGDGRYEPADVGPASGAKHTLGVYHDYAELTSELTDYAAEHPDIARLVSIGQSVQGRELWAMKITDSLDLEQDEPEVKYVSTMHGDEPVGTEMCLYLIDYLLNGYGADPRATSLVDELETWIVPLMNPDGREAHTRGNAQGYDLNRSFPEGSSEPIGNIFDGPPMDTAGRPAEVVHVMEWSADHSFTLSANYHTGALVVNYPYDNDGLGSVDSPAPDDELFEQISEAYSVHNSPMWNSPVFYHGITNGAAWYAINGGMQDWHYRYLSCNEVTIELSDVKWPAESTLPGFWADNQESMLSYFETVHVGARGVVTDAATGEPLYAKVLVEGNSHPVFTDPDVGDYQRMLPAGTYDLTFSAAGYAGRTIRGVVVADGPTTRLDVALAPLDGGIVLIGGQWTGEAAVEAVDTNVVLTVDDGAGYVGTTNAFDVAPGAVDEFDWSEIPSPQVADLPFEVTITARDANGYRVSDFLGPVSLKGQVGGGEVTIGAGTSSWYCPMRTNFHDCRTQVIYLDSELAGPATFTALSLDVTQPPGETMDDWTIRMKHTDLDSYATPSWEGSGWTTVYQGDEAVTATGWATFSFSTPFEYNGLDNLMIDFSFSNSSYSGDGFCRYTDAGQTRSIYYYTDGLFGDPLDWSGTGSPTPRSSTYVPNVRLAAGSVVSTSPGITGAFVDGAWSGQITIGQEVLQEMHLVADDGSGHTGESNEFIVVAEVQPGEIHGSKWHDLNGNGARDAGEPGLGDWTILLDGPAKDSATTDPNGDYAFVGLMPGTYTVTEELPDHWTQTAPASGSHSVIMTSGLIVTAVDFGNAVSGDATGDGKVDYVDLGRLATYYDQTGKSWTDGDFTGDGTVDFVDLGILATNYDYDAFGGGKGEAPQAPAGAEANGAAQAGAAPAQRLAGGGQEDGDLPRLGAVEAPAAIAARSAEGGAAGQLVLLRLNADPGGEPAELDDLVNALAGPALSVLPAPGA